MPVSIVVITRAYTIITIYILLYYLVLYRYYITVHMYLLYKCIYITITAVIKHVTLYTRIYILLLLLFTCIYSYYYYYYYTRVSISLLLPYTYIIWPLLLLYMCLYIFIIHVYLYHLHVFIIYTCYTYYYYLHTCLFHFSPRLFFFNPIIKHFVTFFQCRPTHRSFSRLSFHFVFLWLCLSSLEVFRVHGEQSPERVHPFNIVALASVTRATRADACVLERYFPVEHTDESFRWNFWT